MHIIATIFLLKQQEDIVGVGNNDIYSDINYFFLSVWKPRRDNGRRGADYEDVSSNM